MKRALLILAAFVGTACSSLAQVTSISVEQYYTDDQTISGYPAGHTTYRIYANTTNPTDRVTVVSGDDQSPLVLNVGGQGIWNHPNGAEFGDNINCAVLGAFPALEYDSYMTVGYTCNDDGAIPGLYGVQQDTDTWQSDLFATEPYGDGNLIISSVVGGAWFVLNTNVHGEGGADNKVLLAQITTDGDVCGIFNLQVFPEYAGPGSPYIFQQGFQFGNNDCGTPGCTDSDAINYDDTADFNNGLCLYECGLEFEAVTSIDPTCFGDDDGSITFKGTGNQSYIRYYFDAEDLGLSELSVTKSGLPNGTYTLMLHDTRFDNETLNPGNLYGVCEVEQDVTLNTELLFINASTSTNVSCHDEGDACVNTAVGQYGGGTGELTYMIYTNTNVAVNDGSGNPLELTEPNYCGLNGGNLHFVVTDENGCTANGANFVITNPGTLTLFEGAEQAASCFNSDDAEQVITWAGGTGDIDFSLEDDGTYDIEGNPGNLFLQGLTPGAHQLYAIDDNDCEASFTFNVAGGPAITITPTVTEPSCNGDADGAIALMAGGGTGTLQFSFDCVNFSSTATVSDLQEGTYTVCVKDANDCVASQNVNVTEPEVLGATATGDDITCNGDGDGSITVTGTGGTEPYAYSTTDGDYSPSPVITDLEAGTYDIYVMDANGCSFMLADAAEVVEPAVLGGTATATNVTCNGDCDGMLMITATGGTATYTYSVNGSAASSNANITGLCPGDFDITIIDAHGCTFDVVATANITQPAELVITGLSADPINSDPGGNTAYTVTGGTSPYSYEWTNGNNVVVSTSQDLPDLTGASQAGTYTVEITDDNGCTVSQQIIVTGVGEFGQDIFITLYPNPNNGNFLINISGMKGEKMSYAVVDGAGRIAFAKELGNVNGTRIEEISMTGAAAGIYNVQLNIGTQVHSMRFIKN